MFIFLFQIFRPPRLIITFHIFKAPRNFHAIFSSHNFQKFLLPRIFRSQVTIYGHIILPIEETNFWKKSSEKLILFSKFFKKHCILLSKIFTFVLYNLVLAENARLNRNNDEYIMRYIFNWQFQNSRAEIFLFFFSKSNRVRGRVPPRFFGEGLFYKIFLSDCRNRKIALIFMQKYSLKKSR